MEHFAGLDVAIDETAVCVVDATGEVVMRASVATDPQVIAQILSPFAASLRRVGHEACSLSPWLQPGLKALGLPAVCLETRHVRAALTAQRNKTDATDALGLAHLMRTGWFKTAHVKSDAWRPAARLIVRTAGPASTRPPRPTAPTRSAASGPSMARTARLPRPTTSSSTMTSVARTDRRSTRLVGSTDRRALVPASRGQGVMRTIRNTPADVQNIIAKALRAA